MRIVPYLVAGVLATTPASADTDVVTFAAGANVVAPLGSWGARSGIGFGAQLDARYALSPRLAATARLQPVLHLASNHDSTREVAMLFGLHASIAPRVAVTFGAGASYWAHRLDFEGFHEQETNIGIAGSLAIEVAVHRQVALGLGIFSPDLLRGGLTRVEAGAHRGEDMIGVAGSASLTWP